MSNIKSYTCSCGEFLIKSTSSGLKVRGKVLIVEDGVTKSVCKSCNTEVVLPITIQPSITLEKSVNKKIVVPRKKVVEVK